MSKLILKVAPDSASAYDLSTVSIHKSDEALLLWLELFKAIDSPFVSNDFGDTYCFFCGSWESLVDSSTTVHLDECVWIRARKLCDEATTKNG